jgi:hypothetical protein
MVVALIHGKLHRTPAYNLVPCPVLPFQHKHLGDILNYGGPDVAAHKYFYLIAFFRAEKSGSNGRLMMHDTS